MGNYISLAYALLFVASPFVLFAVGCHDRRKEWRRFGDALSHAREKMTP